MTNTPPQTELLQFISSQIALKNMKFITSMKNGAGFGTKLLKTLLLCCPNLILLHLQFFSPDSTLDIDAAVFMKMKSSKLQYLFIECRSLSINAVELLNKDSLSENRSLQFLCLYALLPTDFIYDLFIQKFRGLKHLELNWFNSNKIVESIATCQVSSTWKSVVLV